jgi:hypothetical protein
MIKGENMYRILCTFLLFLAFAASLSAKEKYQDAVFVDSRQVEDGVYCSLEARPSGNPTSDSVDISGPCNVTHVTQYRIIAGGYIYMLQHVIDHPKAFLFTMGYSMLSENRGILSVVMRTGTPMQIRFDKNGKIVHVKIGKKESRYQILPGTVRQ